MSIATRILELRKLNSLSQAAFAKLINVSPGNVGDWEKGRSKPGADAIISISKNFNVTTDWLLIGNDLTESSNSEIDLEIDEYNLLDFYRNSTKKGKLEIHSLVKKIWAENQCPKSKLSNSQENISENEITVTKQMA